MEPAVVGLVADEFIEKDEIERPRRLLYPYNILEHSPVAA